MASVKALVGIVLNLWTKMINNIKEFPDLFGLSSKGKIKYWTISAIQFDNIRAKVSVTHGYADHPDSFQTNEKEIYSKNIGKKIRQLLTSKPVLKLSLLGIRRLMTNISNP